MVLSQIYCNIYTSCIRIKNSSLLSDQQKHKMMIYIVMPVAYGFMVSFSKNNKTVGSKR
jgi:hypothetical protein